jgi:hypothetical protein
LSNSRDIIFSFSFSQLQNTTNYDLRNITST